MKWLGSSWAATVFALLACSSSFSDQKDAPKDTGPTASKACADVANARCSLRSSCSSLPGASTDGAMIVSAYGDLATCVEREAMLCMNALQAPQTGNTPAKIEGCVATFPSESCQSFFDNNPPDACVPSGPRATGNRCAFNAQCQSGYCETAAGSLCGACSDPPAAGSDCTVSACGHNQRCLQATLTCEAVVARNQACDDTHPCDSGLVCPGSSTDASRVCQTAVSTAGASCGGKLPGCDATLGLYCSGPQGNKTCTLATFADPGMACGSMSDGSRVECRAGNCYGQSGPVTGADTGICKGSVRETAADPSCDTLLGPSCMAPAHCVTTNDTSGTCQLSTGTACD
jgi:hypothetical protein